MNTLVQHLNKKNNQFEINYLQIRRAVGWLGILLPIVVSLGTLLVCDCKVFKDSISNYYYTAFGNVFTGILCGVALFLYSYKGVQKWDNYASSIACTGALGVAFFPMNVKAGGACDVVARAIQPWRDYAHFISATVLFVTLALMSLFLFVKSSTKKPTGRKAKRNIIYRACGIIMLACCVGTLLVKQKILHDFSHSTFIFETIMLWAFGFSWLVKGETILKDK